MGIPLMGGYYRPTAALVALLAFATPAGLRAQTVALGDTALAHADTTGAIAAYNAAARAHPRDAEASFRAGQLYLIQFLNDGRVDSVRHLAEDRFRDAIRADRDSAKYWLGLVEVLRSMNSTKSRMQAADYVDTAVKVARRHGGAAVAEVEYRAGIFEWERYEQMMHRYLFNGGAIGVDATSLATDWRYTEDFFRRQVHPDNSDAGLPYREAAEDHLRAAVTANPRYVTAAGLLVVLLGDQHRWEEAYDAARTLRRAAPDSGRAMALLGLTLARLNRWREAQTAFDRALAHMTPAERAPYDNLTMILKAADSTRLAVAPCGELLGVDSTYWLASQPLFLDNVNETKVEFYARITFVTYRWSDPLRGYQGWQSDRGAVYIRYGPPDIWATLGRDKISNGWISKVPGTDVDGQPTMVDEMHDDPVGGLDANATAIAWVYRRAHLGFVFAVAPGFARGIFVGDNRAFYREARNNAPVRFDNVPAVRDIDTVDLQVAQFRSDTSPQTDVAIFSFMPIGKMTRSAARLAMNLETAAIVKDTRMQDVVRDRRDEHVEGGDTLQIERRTWRLGLLPQEYLLRVEARLPVLDRAARGATPLRVRSYAGDTLMVSDIVLAGHLEPRDSTPSSWTDFFLEPSAGRFAPRQPVSLLWEIYNLTTDSTGVARYHVETRITVREIQRYGFAASVVGAVGDALGLSAKGDAAVSLAYDRQTRVTPHGRQVEYLTFDVLNAPNATYDVAIAVTDRLTGRVTVSPPRRLVIAPSPSPN